MIRKIFNFIPLLIGLFFLSSFCYHYTKYSKFFDGATPHEVYDMLSVIDYYSYWGFFLILLGIILSFFINNKKLKWFSILILVITYFIIFTNMGKFNLL